MAVKFKVRWKTRAMPKPPKNAYMQVKVGQLAFHLIRRRVLATARLGNGRKLPQYAPGWYIAPANDSRFSGGEDTHMVFGHKGIRWVPGDTAPSKVWEDGYEAAKGGEPRTQLTGAMWSHGRVSLGRRGRRGRKRSVISVGFYGSQVVSETEMRELTRDDYGRVTGSRVSTTKRGKARYRRKRVKNQQKADALQRINDDGSRAKKPQRFLMSLTPFETTKVLRSYTRGVRWLSG